MSKPTKPLGPKRGLSLEDLDKLCREPVKIAIPLLNGAPVEIEARRLTPAEAGRVNLELRRAMPKIVPGEKPGEDRFDLTDPDYQKRRQEALVRARALAIYLAIPIFQAAKPGLQDAEEITAFVQSRLTEEVLALLFGAIVPALEDQVAQATSFFS
jgi:hypothetical protein